MEPRDVNEIAPHLEAAARKGASDLLLTAGAPPTLRIDGELTQLEGEPLAAADVSRILTQLLTPEEMRVFQEERELDFAFSFGADHRFRGNAYWQTSGAAVALRLLPSRIPTLEELGLPAGVGELAQERQGLILVAGPTGHGKSTTQAAMVGLINRQRAAHIITVEDPVEFIHRNDCSVVDQREVGHDTRSFAAALRHVLRQAPDVILVGELRDLETVSTVLTAAETGHLVLATLHTNDAAQTVDRMVDMFPSNQQGQARSQLSMVLLAVISQRLLPRAQGKGRVLATEILRNTPAIAHMIREGRSHNLYAALETGAREGMVTLDSSLRAAYRAGKISREMAQRWMRQPDLLFR